MSDGRAAPGPAQGSSTRTIVEITDASGRVVEPLWLARAEAVHRQLRPQLPSDYAAKMARVFADGGRMFVCAESEAVVGVAVWRAYENTFDGLRFYVDDLVTDEAVRSTGVGKALLDACKQRAQALGHRSFALDSGVQRAQAHKFYFREGMTVSSFSFRQLLEPQDAR